jgi:carboxyl-terminal processing protease
VGQSDARARRRLAFFTTVLMPQVFTLGLEDGRNVRIDRAAPRTERCPALGPDAVTTSQRADGTVVITIPSFDDPKYEADAIAAVRRAAGAPLIVFDVRGNGGGSTPSGLLAAIMERPYAGTLVATPLTIAQFDATESVEPGSHPLPRAMVRSGPDWIQPDPAHVSGPMALVMDGGCGSACEDFAIRFQSGARGPVLGEASFGSTGQPIHLTWPRWKMALRISTKREYLPDGSPFEGVGVEPGIKVPLQVADLRAAGDPQLDRAIAAAKKTFAP